MTLEQLEGRKMSVFEQGLGASICQVTMATAFENVNLHLFNGDLTLLSQEGKNILRPLQANAPFPGYQ